jgi:hypothetical protein
MGHILSAAYLSTQAAPETKCAEAHYRKLADQVAAHMTPLQVRWSGPEFPRQVTLWQELAGNTPPAEWDAAYVRLSGYVGLHGPAVFAAAPMLLAALKLARNNLRDGTNPATVDQIDAAIAAAERQP